MNIFDITNNKFFKPLAGKNCKIHWDLICLLIDSSGKNSAMTEAFIKETINEYIEGNSCVLETDENEENVGENLSSIDNASGIIRYLRECGWLSERSIDSNGNKISKVMPYCRRMIVSLKNVFIGNPNEEIENRIFSIRDILNGYIKGDEGRKAHPYRNVLKQIGYEQEKLNEELLYLESYIEDIANQINTKILSFSDAEQYMTNDEYVEKFFHEYKELRQGGVIPFYITEILSILDILRDPEKSYTKSIVSDCMKTENIIEDDAIAKTENILRTISNFLLYDYEEIAGRIDDNIGMFARMYNNRILIVTSNGMNLEEQLDIVLEYLRTSDKEDSDDLISKLSSYSSFIHIECLGLKSLDAHKKRKQRENSDNIVIKEDLTQEEIEDEINRIDKQEENESKYGSLNALAYLKSHFAGKKTLSTEELNLQSDEDGMMLMASILNAGTYGFPYDINAEYGYCETKIGTVSNFTITEEENAG